MKEKILNVLKSSYFQCVVAVLLSTVMTYQEIYLGNPEIAWFMGLIVPIAFGALFELFRLVTGVDEAYQWKNVMPWIIGGIAGVGVAYII